MIEGHYYLSMIIPPFEKWPWLVVGLISAFIIGHLFVKGILAYGAWRTRIDPSNARYK